METILLKELWKNQSWVKYQNEIGMKSEKSKSLM